MVMKLSYTEDLPGIKDQGIATICTGDYLEIMDNPFKN
jgi:hypothetical protein